MTVTNAGTFDFNVQNEDINNLVVRDGQVTGSSGKLGVLVALDMAGGTIDTGSGVLALNTVSAASSSAGESVIAGNLLLTDNANFKLSRGPQDADLVVQAVISESHVGTGINIVGIGGRGHVDFRAVNTYSGATQISGASLFVNNGGSLGTVDSMGTFVNSGGSIVLENVTVAGEPLTIGGAGIASDFGAALVARGNSAWNGPIVLTADTTLSTPDSSQSLSIGSPISGAGGLTKIGNGILTLTSTTLSITGNTYSGTTNVLGGTLQLLKPQSIPGTLNIGEDLNPADSVAVQAFVSNTLSPIAPVIIHASGLLNIVSGVATVGSLSGNGDVHDSDTLNVGQAASSVFSGTIQGIGALNKIGNTNFTLTGGNSLTGPVVIGAGALIVDGTLGVTAPAANPITVLAGRLGGTGSVGRVFVATSASSPTLPVLGPGDADTAAGSLHILNGISFAILGATLLPPQYVVQLNGTTPGSGYDQIDVVGSVNLGGATLVLGLGFSPAVGTAFTIVNNDGVDAVVGTFAGLAQGAVFSVGGAAFSINYKGGTGNDVVLTRVRTTNLAVTVLPLSPVEGAAFNAIIARFTSSDPAPQKGSNYTATIKWGDGATSVGVITANPTGGFNVTAGHTFAEEGTFATAVTVLDTTTRDTLTTAGSVRVSDATLTATLKALAVSRGVAFTATVATFIDADPAGTVSDYTASIAWGDGAVSVGKVTAGPLKAFTVTASHIYAANGTFTAIVTIKDTGGAFATAKDTVTVASPPSASITGSVFNDANANGALDTGELGLTGWRVYIDANNNGKFDAAEKSLLSDKTGHYAFTGLTAGKYIVREVPQTGLRQTLPTTVLPTAGAYMITLAAGAASANTTFGNTTKALISGTVFDDKNGDGKPGTGEPGLAKFQVFLDTNNNLKLDPGEASTLTDALGAYHFDVVPGSYRVREIVPTGYKATSPVGGVFAVSLCLRCYRDRGELWQSGGGRCYHGIDQRNSVQ